MRNVSGSIRRALAALTLLSLPGVAASAQPIPDPAGLLSSAIERALPPVSSAGATAWIVTDGDLTELLGAWRAQAPPIDLEAMGTRSGRQVGATSREDALSCPSVIRCKVRDDGHVVTVTGVERKTSEKDLEDVTLWVRVRWAEHPDEPASRLVGYSVKYLMRFESGRWGVIKTLETIVV